MNHALARLAARQYGFFDLDQARAAGLPESTLSDHVRGGRLISLQPGVYAPGGTPAIWEREAMAAVLAAGPGAVASHRSAARWWKIGEEDDPTIEVSVPRPRFPRLHGVVLHRSGDLVGEHSVVWRNLPVTKPARTIVDLAAVLPRPRVEDALDRALVRRLITVSGLELMRSELSRHGRPGTGVIRRILDERALGAARPDGLLEPRMARLLRAAGLPPARFQFVIQAPDGTVLAIVDFAYPEILLALEVDGYEVHGSPRAMAKDFVRQNGLVPLGWRVLRFTWAQVVRNPDDVAATVKAAIGALTA